MRDLVPTDPENWRKLEIRQIDESDRIRPASLDSRVFVDPSRNFGKLVDLDNWQPKVTFIKKLINRLHEYLEKLKSTNNSSLDLYEFGNLIRQRKRDKAILHRLREHENMKNLKKEDIDSIVELLMTMEPFCSELIKIKEETIAQTRLEIETKAEQEISSICQEKAGLKLQIIDLKNETAELYRKAKEEIEQERKKAQEEVEDIRCNAQEKIELELVSMRQEKSDMEQNVMELQKEADELGLTIETQHTRMNQTLDEFEKSLNNRLNRLVVEPSSMLAEALANDAFLQLVFGKNKQGLDLKLSTSYPKEIPSFKINKDIIFDTTNLLLTTYKKRLERVDLDEALASWTTAIALAGLMPVFKGSAIRRTLSIFTNHLTHGRCFELPLSPEIISVERLFTIGQSSDATSLGILDTALLYAANHREALFILVLEGLDRAPSQYFLDTLLDWYMQGLLDIPGDTFLSQHLNGLCRQGGLADDVINWPSNLLLAATINGLTDGFPVSSTAMAKIIEVIAETQGKHLDIHPAILDQNACKPVGEVTTSQWNDWRQKAQDQDVSLMAQLINNLPESEQKNAEKNETALRIFAALCVLENPHDDAMSIVQRYFIKIS